MKSKKIYLLAYVPANLDIVFDSDDTNVLHAFSYKPTAKDALRVLKEKYAPYDTDEEYNIQVREEEDGTLISSILNVEHELVVLEVDYEG